MTIKKESRIGKNQFYLCDWSIESPRAVIQLIHGMVEHIGRYDAFARKMNEQGFAALGNDHIGHGKTAKEDTFGVFPEDHGELIRDLEQVNAEARRRYPGLPVILLGHSMGSMLLRQFIAEYPDKADALIIMGTAQQSRLKTAGGILLAEMIKLLYGGRHRSKLLRNISTEPFNRYFRPLKTGADWLSSDENEARKYLADPYNHFSPTVNMHLAIFRFAHEVAGRKCIGKIPRNMPIYLVSGECDPLGGFGKDIKTLYRIFQELHFEHVQMALYPRARHEILNELEREKVMADIAAWIEALL